MALSDFKIRTTKPTERDFKLSDSDGLYLLVRPNGSKLWRMNYRHLGKNKTLAIGKYPDIALSAARDKRAEARRLLAEGVDPSYRKQVEIAKAKVAAANTFEAVAEEYLVSLARDRSEGTVRVNSHILRKKVYPLLGRRPIAELRPHEILEALQSIEDGGQVDMAHRARALMGKVFQLAALSDRAPTDPTVVLRGRLKSRRVQNRASVTSEQTFAPLLRRIDTYEGSPSVRAAMLFLAHTFVRTVELRFATWSEIDLEDGVWRIPEERMKMGRPHDVPLTASTRAILRDMAKFRRGDYIFVSAHVGKSVLGDGTLRKAMKSIGYRGKMTPHGFRSSASSILNERGYRSDVIEMQLAHVEKNAVRRAYNRTLYWNERVSMMQDWSNLVDGWRKR
ncbi:tyrosine-type recombinase/integrase [Rhodomicrobium sp.]|uniref:tyrosine-type recombinase/integrase n=1 Tax=Rhodomicrobium sp. TaxID=2720632 RepID=UPI0039E4B00F